MTGAHDYSRDPPSIVNRQIDLCPKGDKQFDDGFWPNMFRHQLAKRSFDIIKYFRQRRLPFAI